MPIWPGSPRPSPAQRGRGEPGSDLGHDILASAEPNRAGRVREVAQGGGLSLPVIDLPALIAGLDQRQRPSGPPSPGVG
jgi:hypothetical protein